MRSMFRNRIFLAFAAILFLTAVVLSRASVAGRGAGIPPEAQAVVTVSSAVAHDISPPLFSLAPADHDRDAETQSGRD